jgi:hypothetical protein
MAKKKDHNFSIHAYRIIEQDTQDKDNNIEVEACLAEGKIQMPLRLVD